METLEIGSPGWADETIGWDRDPINCTLYHCPRCGKEHEELRCYEQTYWNNPDKDDRENGKSFVPVSTTQCVPGEWMRCTGCFSWCRKEDTSELRPGWKNLGYCPSCSTIIGNLKCNGCGIIRDPNSFDQIKRAPYVRVWECWKCKSRDVSPTNEQEPKSSETLIVAGDPINQCQGPPYGYVFIDVDKTIRPTDIYWSHIADKWLRFTPIELKDGLKVFDFGFAVARLRTEYSRDYDT